MKNHFLGKLFSFRKENNVLDCKHTAVVTHAPIEGPFTEAVRNKDRGPRAFPTDEQLGQLYRRIYSPLRNTNSQKRQEFIEFAKIALKEFGNDS